MKILSLILENFQGIKAMAFDLNGANANIYGSNATGKTTIYNAFTWLLFGKASTGAANFSPKTKDAEGQDIHYLDHSVAAKLRLDGGAILTLRKTLSENWKKKRGSNAEEFSGHNTAYEVDGVPVSESAYNAKIAEIIPQDKAKILCGTAHFPEVLSWQDRRKILLDVCGDVSDKDIINGSAELKDLRDYLKKPGDPNVLYTVDEAVAVIKSQMRRVNDELEGTPVRIDECTKAVPDLTGLSRETTKANILRLEKERDGLANSKASMTQDTATAALNEELSKLRVSMNELKGVHLANENRKAEQLTQDLDKIKADLPTLESAIRGGDRVLDELRHKLRRTQQDRGILTARYREKEAELWDGDSVCKTCGQSLPADAVSAACESWEAEKKQSLQRIYDEMAGSCSKDIIAGLEADTSKNDAECEDLKLRIGIIKELAEKRTAAQSDPIPFESTEPYIAINAEISRIQDKISSGQSDVQGAKDEIQGKIDALESEILVQQEIISKFNLAAQQENRINELSAQEKELAKEYERLEKGLFLCELFIKSKVEAITDRINAKFKAVSFRLFIEQINGGIREDCEVLVPGEMGLVPYSTANNAARINAGIEIINVLSKHWGVSLPLFVDNRESVVTLALCDAQVISLIVSEENKSLKLEVL